LVFAVAGVIARAIAVAADGIKASVRVCRNLFGERPSSLNKCADGGFRSDAALVSQ